MSIPAGPTFDALSSLIDASNPFISSDIPIPFSLSPHPGPELLSCSSFCGIMESFDGISWMWSLNKLPSDAARIQVSVFVRGFAI
jgi:hypothetical protein